MPDLVVSDRCGSSALLEHLRPTATPGAVRIDLAGLTFCEPLGLVAIAALADRAASVAEVIFTPPRSPSVARYLARMHLGQVLNDLGVDHRLPNVQEQRRSDVLVELTRFGHAGEAEALARLVHHAVEPIDPAAASALFVGLTEISNNVPRHARRPHGYLAAQKTHQGHKLLFAVADGGVGIFKTLRPHGARDAGHALEMAVLRGATEMPQQSSGGTLRDVAEEIRRCGGYLQVVSGDASLTVGTSSRRETSWQEFDGTAVQGAVHRRLQP